jgi:hypothetical protein
VGSMGRESIFGKGARQLSHELSELKVLIAANPVFDYAERAETAWTHVRNRAELNGACDTGGY